jgi:hypothetical protein
LGSFGQNVAPRVGWRRVRSAGLCRYRRNGSGSFGQDRVRWAAPLWVRSAASCWGTRNASPSRGEDKPTRSGACGQRDGRSAGPPYWPPRKGQADEDVQPRRRARPEPGASHRSLDRRLQGRSAAEPFPITLSARHKLGHLAAMRAQMGHRTPRLRVCGARGRELRNGRSRRRGRGWHHPRAARRGNRRGRAALATHRPEHRRSGRPSRNAPPRQQALRWRAPGRRPNRQMRDQGPLGGSAHVVRRCARSTPCPQAFSDRGCDGRSCGSLRFWLH